MRHDPIDYNSPVGISKKEWVKVLGANLILLLIVYAVAMICTLCGNDIFILEVQNSYLQRMEETLRGIGIYQLVKLAFATIEETIMLCFVMLRKPKWWWPVTYYGVRLANNLIFMAIGAKVVLGWTVFLINILFLGAFVISFKKKCLKPLLRMGIAIAVSLLLNEGIAIFRTKICELNHLYTNIEFFYLSIEYDLALLLALGLLAFAIPWNKQKGEPQQCQKIGAVGGSSPTLKKKSPKNSLTKNNISPKALRRIRWLKARMFTLQLVALVFIALFPLAIGKSIEFALMYVAFCLTRLILGFTRSLHFKSEAICISVGTLTFWGVTLLTPDAKLSIIASLIYGAGLAIAFRLYWELHDLIMYHRAAKTDRYAMLYTVFKGSVDPRRINGMMRAKGYFDKDDIAMIQMYMQREKIEYIATRLKYAKITIDVRLTDIAKDLYSRR